MNKDFKKFDYNLEKGKDLLHSGNVEKGREFIEKALGLQPENEYAVFEMGNIYLVESDYQRAAEIYKKSIELNKNFLNPRMELAKIYILQSKLKKAQKELNYVLKHSQNSESRTEALAELGKIYRLYTRKEDTAQLKRILKGFSQNIQAVESDIKYGLEMAKIYRRTGSADMAADIFKKLLGQKNIKNDKFLYNKILNELEITQKKEVLNSKARSMVAMILDRCNIRCRICEIWKSKWQARPQTMKEIVELFPYLEDINWEGGEVFMMEGFDDILKEGGKHENLRQVVYTNGLMINERLLNKIQNIRADIVFSIDSTLKETYEYIRRGGNFEKLKKVLSLVREFRKSHGKDKIKIYLNPVIMKSNYKELMALVEFAHKYRFDALTFNPLRGNYGDENIFDRRDEKAIEYIRSNMPAVHERANKYGVRLNNWLPVDELCEDEDSGEADNSGRREEKEEESVEEGMICYAPWQRLVLDNVGNIRPHVFCLNKWVGNSDEMSLAEIWNGKGMREYRRKIAEGDFKDICQPECISGQVRENTREIN